MSKPRTPDYFPRMKVRGGRRRRDAAVLVAWRFDLTPVFASVTRSVDAARAALVDMGRQMGKALESTHRVIRLLLWRADRARDERMSHRMLPATPSPWAAPIQKES